MHCCCYLKILDDDFSSRGLSIKSGSIAGDSIEAAQIHESINTNSVPVLKVSLNEKTESIVTRSNDEEGPYITTRISNRAVKK